MSGTRSNSDGLEQVREHREELVRIAESDLPAAWIARELLEAATEDRHLPQKCE